MADAGPKDRNKRGATLGTLGQGRKNSKHGLTMLRYAFVARRRTPIACLLKGSESQECVVVVHASLLLRPPKCT